MTEGTLNRVKAASAGKPLQSCEMAIFLKVLPVLETLSQTLVERLEERLTAHSTEGADFCIGDVYLDMSALFVAYTSYASMVPEAEKVLNHPALAELATSLEEELAPLTMAQHLAVRGFVWCFVYGGVGLWGFVCICMHLTCPDTNMHAHQTTRQAPMEAAQRMAVQMKAVLDMTPEQHPDRKNLELATIMMEQTASGMQGALADTKNYWRLVEIKDSIASMELQASPLDTLVDANRKLVRPREGSLLGDARRRSNLNPHPHPLHPTATATAAGGHAPQGLPLQGQGVHVLALLGRPPLRHPGTYLPTYKQPPPPNQTASDPRPA